MNYDNNWLYSYLWALAIKTILKNDSFSIIIKSMRHFLGSVGVREGSVFYQAPSIFHIFIQPALIYNAIILFCSISSDFYPSHQWSNSPA